MRQEFAARSFDREIFLMVAHHRDQHFFGQFKKSGIEAAENDGWPLRQIDNRIQQNLVFTPAGASNRAGRSVQSFANLLLSLVTTQNFDAAQCFYICKSCARDWN